MSDTFALVEESRFVAWWCDVGMPRQRGAYRIKVTCEKRFTYDTWWVAQIYGPDEVLAAVEKGTRRGAVIRKAKRRVRDLRRADAFNRRQGFVP